MPPATLSLSGTTFPIAGEESDRRMKTKSLLLLSLASTALLALDGVHAATEESAASSSSAASDSSVYDVCSDDIWSYGCEYLVPCRICLTKEGCAIESTTGECISASRINASVGAEYYVAGEASYCATDDSACKSCISAENEVCVGQDGCVCIYECSLRSVEPVFCVVGATTTLSNVIFWTAISALVVVAWRLRHAYTPRVTYVSVGIARLARRGLFSRRNGATNSTAPATTATTATALKLDNWRSHLEAHGGEFRDVELKSCFIRMEEDEDDSIERVERPPMTARGERPDEEQIRPR